MSKYIASGVDPVNWGGTLSADISITPYQSKEKHPVFVDAFEVNSPVDLDAWKNALTVHGYKILGTWTVTKLGAWCLVEK